MLGARRERGMLSLDEAIKDCEEVAEKNEEESKNWEYGASQINDDENRKKKYQKHAEMWREFASEHRQLADWLRELRAYRKAEKEIERDANRDERDDIDDGKSRGLFLATFIIQHYKNEEVNAEGSGEE